MCECKGKHMSKQGYTLTLAVNKTAGGSYTDTENFIVNLSFWNVNVILWSSGSQSAVQESAAETAVCFRFSRPSHGVILCSAHCAINVLMNRGRVFTGCGWTWMGVGRDRSRIRCVGQMAQRVSPLTSAVRKHTGMRCSSENCAVMAPASEGGLVAIFRDVVSTGGGVLRTSTSWFFFIDQCH